MDITVLLDVMMRSMDDLERTRRARELRPDLYPAKPIAPDNLIRGLLRRG